MRKLLSIAVIFMFGVLGLNAQRMDIGTQLVQAPTGDVYMVVTDQATGNQEYALVTDIFVGGGSGDVIQGVTYDGDTLEIQTNLGDYQPIINAGNMHTTELVNIDNVGYAVGTPVQIILNNLANNIGGGSESTTVSDGTTLDLTLTGFDITGEVIDGSITPVKLDRTYLESEVDGSVTNEIQTISKSGSTITLSDGGGSFTDNDSDPSNEIELPSGGNMNDVLQTDGSGNYSWTPQTGGSGESTTVSDGTTIDFTLSGTDITGEVVIDPVGTNTITNNSGLLVENEIPSGGSNGDVLQTDGSGNYSWTAQSGGGGVEVYSSGNALIKASGLGVTYSLSGNVGTVTVPNGVRLDYVRLNENSSNIGNATDYTLRVVDGNADVNQGTVSTYMPPITQFIKRDNLNNDPPTTTFPFVNAADAPPSPQMQITGYGSNQIDVTFKNVDSFTEWTAIAIF